MRVDKYGNVEPYPPLPKWLRAIGLVIAGGCILCILPVALAVGLIFLPFQAVEETFNPEARHE